MAQTRLVVVLLAACGAPLSQVASEQFTHDSSCASAVVTPRPDLNYLGTFFEVSGCGSDVIYDCSNPAYESCAATTYCTKPGCATDDRSNAAVAFANNNACPAERVTVAAATDPATPPADVAADPARLTLWTSTERDRTKGKTFWAATGCGRTMIYRCVDIPPYAPTCGPPLAGERAPARQP